MLDAPELHLSGSVLVPGLAGWRRERPPHVPEELTAFELAPDWICEVLSAATSTLDRVRKMPVYAREGVQFAWLLEPIQRTLEVFQSQGQQWHTVGTWEGDVKVRAVPFDAIELDLRSLWADIRRRGEPWAPYREAEHRDGLDEAGRLTVADSTSERDYAAQLQERPRDTSAAIFSE